MVVILNIRLTKVSIGFQSKTVFRHLNLEIAEHRITCIMGPSGVGKTTLIHMIMGLLKPEEGKIEGLEGRKIAAVFQEDRLCEAADAITNVQIVQKNKVSAEIIKAEFAKVGLTDYENKPVSQLSGGMKRRVAIVRALSAESDIIIMDEPLKGLDEALKLQVTNYIKDKVQGKTVIIVTHDKEDITVFDAELITL